MVFDWVVAHTPAEAEAVAIGGNGVSRGGTIAALEERLQRPVVTANQALLWAALGSAGADTSTVRGYGSIFERVTNPMVGSPRRRHEEE